MPSYVVLFEWGRISRNWHVKKFLPCQEKMIWAWLVWLNKSEIYVSEVQPNSRKNGPDEDRVTFDFICYINICIDMDYVLFMLFVFYYFCAFTNIYDYFNLLLRS